MIPEKSTAPPPPSGPPPPSIGLSGTMSQRIAKFFYRQVVFIPILLDNKELIYGRRSNQGTLSAMKRQFLQTMSSACKCVHFIYSTKIDVYGFAAKSAWNWKAKVELVVKCTWLGSGSSGVIKMHLVHNNYTGIFMTPLIKITFRQLCSLTPQFGDCFR